MIVVDKSASMDSSACMNFKRLMAKLPQSVLGVVSSVEEQDSEAAWDASTRYLQV